MLGGCRPEHRIEQLVVRRPVRNVPLPVDVHDQHPSGALVVGADRRDVRAIPVAGEHALVEVHQDEVGIRSFVGGERPAHLGQARRAGVARPDHFDRIVLDAVAVQALLEHRDELCEGDAIAAFGALARPALVADRLEQRGLGDDRRLRLGRQAAGEVDRHGHARHGTGARGELRHVKRAELPVVRRRRRPQIVGPFGDRDRIRAKLGLALEGGSRPGGNPQERKELGIRRRMRRSPTAARHEQRRARRERSKYAGFPCWPQQRSHDERTVQRWWSPRRHRRSYWRIATPSRSRGDPADRMTSRGGRPSRSSIEIR